MNRARNALVAMAAVALVTLATLLPGRAGMTALFVLGGVIPGMALALALHRRAGTVGALVLGIAIGPLASGLAAWGLALAGLELRAAFALVAATGAAALPIAFALAPAASDVPELEVRPAVIAGALLAALVLLPPLVNPWIMMRGDAWIHGGIVWQIVGNGLPPQDPRFAGMEVRYVWIFHVFLALLTAVRGDEPFWFMNLLDAAVVFATAVLAGAMAFQLWRRARAAGAAVVLLVTGMNAGAYLLWPIVLLRALTGEVRGVVEVRRLLSELNPGTAKVVYDLAAPFSRMVNFLDKYLIGTALGYGYLLMLLGLWASLRWLDGRRRDALVWAFVGALGTMFIHGVVALSVVPVAVGTLVLAALLRLRVPWLPPARDLLALAGAWLLGGVVAGPYLAGVASGWSSASSGLRHSYFGVSGKMLWTLLSALFVVGLFTWRPALAAWRERRPLHAVLSLYALAMLAFSCIIQLPEMNQMKFVFQVLVAMIPLAAPGFADWAAGLWRRRRGLALAVFALVFALPPLATWQGFLFDPEGRTARPLHPWPGDAALHGWIRDHTERDAVVVDDGFRDLVYVLGRRATYLGTEYGPERAAFPLDQVTERRAVVADLYGEARDLDSALRSFARFRGPVYVLFRAEDSRPGRAPWRALEARPDRFTPVYAADGNRLYRVRRDGGS